jgi:Tol biopolymer transport system component
MILERGSLLINRYRIVEVLGQGGMGSVYRATDENLDIDVAVKDNLFTSEEYSRQFRREATILATLRHAGLPRVTDHFVVQGQGQYLVMDYIEGEDLRHRMERVSTLPEEEVVVIGAAICDSLMYLCSRNPPVIHRDIKPGNVKITPQGQIFLVDFGLAKTLSGQATTTGARAMTPGFSPPEQYGTARTDMRTDIFSLGATLYSALTGVTPEDSLARAMGQAELTPIRTHNPQISKKVAAAIEKALELRPEDRFQTPILFKQALLGVSTASRRRDGEYYVSPPPEPEKEAAIETSDPDGEVKKGSSKPKLPLNGAIPNGEVEGTFKPISLPKKRKNNVGCLLVSALVIVIVALGSEFYRRDLSFILTRLIPVTTTIVPPSTEAEPISFAGTPTQITIPSLLTESMTAVVTMDVQPEAPTSIPPTQTLAPFRPTATPKALPTPVGGGTGQIAYASNITGIPQIFLINSDGKNRQQITDIPEGACQPDFSPDGQQIVFVSPCDSNTDYYPGSSLYIINLDGSGLLPLPTMVGGDFDPTWSPDGKFIAFTSLRNNRPQLYRLKLSDNSVIVLSEEYILDSQPAWSPDGKRLLFVSQRYNKQDIWVMDADGKNQKQFSHTPFLDLQPSWTPDGKDALITQYVALGGIPRVVIAEFNPNDYKEYEIGKEKRPMRDATMSPDGYWIAFEGWEIGGRHNIYLITTTGISIHQVTDDSTLAFDPVWRPTP